MRFWRLLPYLLSLCLASPRVCLAGDWDDFWSLFTLDSRGRAVYTFGPASLREHSLGPLKSHYRITSNITIDNVSRVYNIGASFLGVYEPGEFKEIAIFGEKSENEIKILVKGDCEKDPWLYDGVVCTNIKISSSPSDAMTKTPQSGLFNMYVAAVPWGGRNLPAAIKVLLRQELAKAPPELVLPESNSQIKSLEVPIKVGHLPMGSINLSFEIEYRLKKDAPWQKTTDIGFDDLKLKLALPYLTKGHIHVHRAGYYRLKVKLSQEPNAWTDWRYFLVTAVVVREPKK